jgi:hypothetical protein
MGVSLARVRNVSVSPHDFGEIATASSFRLDNVIRRAPGERRADFDAFEVATGESA